MTKKLKLLQLGNIAGVSGLLSSMLKEEFPLTIKSKVITRKNQDHYGFDKYYQKSGNASIIGGERAFWFYLYISFYILIRKPNIIQIHGWLKGLKMVNILKKFYLRKPYIIYHGHGSEMRQKEKIVYDLIKTADKIIVSTMDIYNDFVASQSLNYDIKWIPNPIDKKLFFYPSNTNKSKGKALFIRNFLPPSYPYDFLDKVELFCKENNLSLTIIDRMSDHDLSKPYPNALTFGEFIPFNKIGDIFRSHEYLLDFKGFEPVFSKAAIEAATCGAKIVHESFKIYQPSELTKFDGSNEFINYYETLRNELL